MMASNRCCSNVVSSILHPHIFFVIEEIRLGHNSNWETGMGLASLQADIINHRIENRAAVLDEYQPSFTQGDWRASQGVTLGWRPIRPAVLVAAREVLDPLRKERPERFVRRI